MSSSPFPITVLAVSLALLKRRPPELSIKDYIESCRTKLRKETEAGDQGRQASRRHFDQVSNLKSQLEVAQSTILAHENENFRLRNELDLLKTEQKSQKTSRKRKRPVDAQESASDESASKRRALEIIFDDMLNRLPVSAEKQKSVKDDCLYEKKQNVLRLLHNVRITEHDPNRHSAAVLAAAEATGCLLLTYCKEHKLRHSQADHEATSSQESISDPTVFMGAITAVVALLLDSTDNFAGAETLEGDGRAYGQRAVFGIASLFREIFNCFTAITAQAAKFTPPLAAKTSFIPLHTHLGKVLTHISVCLRSSRVAKTPGGCGFVKTEKLRVKAELLDAFAHLLLSHAGAVLRVFVGLQADADPLGDEMLVPRHQIGELELRTAEIEGKTLIPLLRSFIPYMRTHLETCPSRHGQFDADKAADSNEQVSQSLRTTLTLPRTVNETLQATLIKGIFGDLLKLDPEAQASDGNGWLPASLEIEPSLASAAASDEAMLQENEANIGQLFQSEMWSLVGWDVLERAWKDEKI